VGDGNLRGNRTNHAGLKAAYVAGAAAIINPDLAAELTIATNVAGRTDDLGQRYRQVAERNGRQIRRPT
jgi:hypothetical protein